MLLPDNIHPENSIYFNGSIVLQILITEKRIDVFELYQKATDIKEMSYQVFIFCLDWLYLIDAAILENGEVTICS